MVLKLLEVNESLKNIKLNVTYVYHSDRDSEFSHYLRAVSGLWSIATWLNGRHSERCGL